MKQRIKLVSWKTRWKKTPRYSSCMKKEIESINKNQGEVNNKTSEITLEGLKSMLNEAEDRIIDLEDKVEKSNQTEQERKRDSEGMKRS